MAPSKLIQLIALLSFVNFVTTLKCYSCISSPIGQVPPQITQNKSAPVTENCFNVDNNTPIVECDVIACMTTYMIASENSSYTTSVNRWCGENFTATAKSVDMWIKYKEETYGFVIMNVICSTELCNSRPPNEDNPCEMMELKSGEESAAVAIATPHILAIVSAIAVLMCCSPFHWHFL